jgi:ribosomal protein S18 acetylase RimI-like enzyme
MITLRPMSADDYGEWLAGQRAAYIADRVSMGEPEELARRTACEQHASYFPDGRPAERHEVFVAEIDGERVGVVWVGPHPRRPADATAAWLYDIEVVQERRGQGLGRELLDAVEQLLAGSGVDEFSLNVFGDNDRARRLYTSAGYREVAITMSKDLTDRDPTDQD